MAARPWVTPQEVRDYSETEVVQNRTDARLTTDIARAEQYVITYMRNTFEDYETIPDPVKIAVILLAETYASYAYIMKRSSGGAFKSERQWNQRSKTI